ncbi:hypothetical protein ACIQPR_45420 [Streptomyces sp. NPDC091280]|uniref:hypothetical protein n=1 Tax=Streptomyces sp. NPDC091280 TaxID=3365984 RepID=UPI0037F4F994
MTHDNHAPDTELPKFSVNVVPTNQLKCEDLRTMLNLYRRGQITPLIFGDDNKPEAAVIPFAALVRLMKYDHAHEENAFRTELSRRIQASDASSDPGMTLEDLGDELGGPAQAMIRKVLDDGE